MVAIITSPRIFVCFDWTGTRAILLAQIRKADSKTREVRGRNSQNNHAHRTPGRSGWEAVGSFISLAETTLASLLVWAGALRLGKVADRTGVQSAGMPLQIDEFNRVASLRGFGQWRACCRGRLRSKSRHVRWNGGTEPDFGRIWGLCGSWNSAVRLTRDLD